MSEKNSKSSGSEALGIGSILLIVGVLLYFLPYHVTTWYGVTYTSYPYRDTGWILIIISIFLMIFSESSKHRETEDKQKTKEKTCVRCKRKIPADANICPYCGYDYRKDDEN